MYGLTSDARASRSSRSLAACSESKSSWAPASEPRGGGGGGSGGEEEGGGACECRPRGAKPLPPLPAPTRSAQGSVAQSGRGGALLRRACGQQGAATTPPNAAAPPPLVFAAADDAAHGASAAAPAPVLLLRLLLAAAAAATADHPAAASCCCCCRNTRAMPYADDSARLQPALPAMLMMPPDRALFDRKGRRA